MRRSAPAVLAALATCALLVSAGLEAQVTEGTTVPPGATGGTPDRCRGLAHRASDHTLGRWEGTVTVPGPDGRREIDRTVRLEAELELAAGGCAIVERRIVHREGRSESTRVLTVRAYDPDTERWHQLLVSSRPAVIRFRGESGPEGLAFVTLRPERERLVRVTDRPADPVGFDRVVESSDDGGRTWTLDDVVEFRRP
jgi:hypothetical protein